MTYDYLFFDLARDAQLADVARAAIAAPGEMLGAFRSQLGWHAGQAAILARWPDAAGAAREAAVRALEGAAGISGLKRDRLTPTLRPGASDRPPPGGIYVHRWFVVGTSDLPEFLELSAKGWPDFEARFDSHIFGLFSAEQTPEDAASDATRLLLITRYADHGVWEASRDPTTEAMAAFLRRQKLTRDTWAASTLLVGG
jgi:hypothetical protein